MTITINGTTGLTFTDASTLSSATFSPVYPITASAATSALTVTLNPCSLAFRSSTLTSGATVTRTVATAISITVSSGSTLGTVSAKQSRIVVLAIDNAGTVELAVVNISGGIQLDETNLVSTTAEGGAGAADSASIVYSTTARTSLAYRVVGYVESTQATAGTWATAPSTIQGNGGQALIRPSSGSMVRLNTTNGYGSTNTKIRRFTNITTNQGSDITYADSATLGASFTINTSGVYAISYGDQFSSNSQAGLSLNSTQLTTNVYQITIADILGLQSNTANNWARSSWIGYLNAGDVVRPHTDGTGNGVNSGGFDFTIARVA